MPATEAAQTYVQDSDSKRITRRHTYKTIKKNSQTTEKNKLKSHK